MTKKRPAALTSSLLAAKGKASPTASLATPDTPAFGAPGAAGGPPSNSPAEAGPKTDKPGRAKLTMRLDRERHFRLKLVAAHLKRSSQDVLTQALDAYLDRVAPAVMNGGCACLEAAGFGQCQSVTYQESTTGRVSRSAFGGTTPFAPKDPGCR